VASSLSGYANCVSGDSLTPFGAVKKMPARDVTVFAMEGWSGCDGDRPQADGPVFTIVLIAESSGTSEAVEIALPDLALAINGDESLFEA
jgi:hypothetical protein